MECCPSDWDKPLDGPFADPMVPPVSSAIPIASAEPFLRVAGVDKLFGGTRALRGVELSVRRGEIHALLGANGAGKSTLIKILAGVHEADAGRIEIGGAALAEARQRLSFVHQDLGLIESM